MRIAFDKAVNVHLGMQSQVVKTLLDADGCLQSAKWPHRNGPMARMASKAIAAAKDGHLTPGEAREAFIDAAVAAHILKTAE